MILSNPNRKTDPAPPARSSLLVNEFLKLCDDHDALLTDHDALQTEKDVAIAALKSEKDAEIAALHQRLALLEGLATRRASIEKQLGVPAADEEEK